MHDHVVTDRRTDGRTDRWLCNQKDHVAYNATECQFDATAPVRVSIHALSKNIISWLELTKLQQFTQQASSAELDCVLLQHYVNLSKTAPVDQ